MRRRARTSIRGGAVIEQGSNVDLDAIPESDGLDDERRGGEGKQRAPEVLEAFGVVDVTDVAESIRNPGQTQG